MTEIDKLAWIYIKDKRLLCARAYNKATYYLPGGKRDPGEDDAQALAREIKEELSVDIIPNTMQYAGTFKSQADGKPGGILVKMTCYYADYRGEIKPDAEIEEVAWMDANDGMRCSSVTRSIIGWLKEAGKIE